MDLTNDEVRAIVMANKPYDQLLVVVVRPTIGPSQYELFFHLAWEPVLQHYEALTLTFKDGDWFYGDAVEISPEIAAAFKVCLFQLYAIEHVCFTPVERRKAAVAKVLSMITTISI